MLNQLYGLSKLVDYQPNKLKMSDFLKTSLKIWKEWLEKTFLMKNMLKKLKISKLNYVSEKLKCVYLLQLQWIHKIPKNLIVMKMLPVLFNFNTDLNIKLDITIKIQKQQQPKKKLKVLNQEDLKDLNISLTKSNHVSSDKSLP